MLASLQSKLSETLEEKRALKQRNQDLETDCADLQALIKEYEVVLEEVTSKLRNHAVSIRCESQPWFLFIYLCL